MKKPIAFVLLLALSTASKTIIEIPDLKLTTISNAISNAVVSKIISG